MGRMQQGQNAKKGMVRLFALERRGGTVGGVWVSPKGALRDDQCSDPKPPIDNRHRLK